MTFEIKNMRKWCKQEPGTVWPTYSCCGATKMKSFASVLTFVLALNIAFGKNDAGKGVQSLGDVIRALPAEQLESLKKGLSSGQLVKGSKIGEAQMSTACALKIGAMFTKDFKLLIGYLDAIGKPGSGLFLGNGFWPGSFPECHQIAESKYCVAGFLANFKMFGNVSIYKAPGIMGVCMPNICSPSDIRLALNYISTKIYPVIGKYISFPAVGVLSQYGSNVQCEDVDKSYSSGAVATLIICGILCALCLFGTILEMLFDALESNYFLVKRSKALRPSQSTQGFDDDEEDLLHNESGENEEDPLLSRHQVMIKVPQTLRTVADYCICFSLIKNTKAVMNTDAPPGAILSINGIRTISMMWVILGHMYAVGLTAGGIENMTDLAKLLNRFAFLPIQNGIYSVDSFFVLSGLLVSYLSLRRLKEKGKLPIWKFYLHRFISFSYILYFGEKTVKLQTLNRLTPTYGFVILFFTHVYPRMGEGPLWSTLTAKLAVMPCKTKWWTNLIYINNFYPTDLGKECLGWGWYLANDMQFFIISPIIIYAMYWFRWVGTVAVNGGLIIASVIVTSVLISHYNLDSLQIAADAGTRPKTEAESFTDKIYTKPYCRITPYLVGMILGYIIFNKFKLRGRYNWLVAIYVWIVAIVLGMTVVYGTWRSSKKGGHVFTKAENIAYGSLARIAWGIAVSNVIYLCHNGYGGLVDKFLSWRAFMPLSRLTYGAYLLHPMTIMLLFGSKQSSRAYTDLDLGFQFVSVTVTSYAAAFILAIGLEYPILHLDKKIFGR